MYGWTPDYMLDRMTWLEVLMYYENGMKFEETRAQILIGTYARALNHDETETPTVQASKNNSKGPDKAGFQALLSQMR